MSSRPAIDPEVCVPQTSLLEPSSGNDRIDGYDAEGPIRGGRRDNIDDVPGVRVSVYLKRGSYLH
jgi:hypothetical protein